MHAHFNQILLLVEFPVLTIKIEVGRFDKAGGN